MITTEKQNTNEEIISLDIDFSKSVLTLLKKIFVDQTDTLSKAEKSSVIEKIKTHLQTELQESNVFLSNPEDLATYLLDYFSVINPLIQACKSIREKLGTEAVLRLALEKEDYDFSNYAHPVIYIKQANMDREARRSIRALRDDFLDPFIEKGITFGCRPELH